MDFYERGPAVGSIMKLVHNPMVRIHFLSQIFHGLPVNQQIINEAVLCDLMTRGWDPNDLSNKIFWGFYASLSHKLAVVRPS